MKSKGEMEAIIACIVRERHPSIALSSDYDMETARLVLNEIGGNYQANHIRIDEAIDIAEGLCDLGGDVPFHELDEALNNARS
jgi:hypothetical protein